MALKLVGEDDDGGGEDGSGGGSWWRTGSDRGIRARANPWLLDFSGEDWWKAAARSTVKFLSWDGFNPEASGASDRTTRVGLPPSWGEMVTKTRSNEEIVGLEEMNEFRSDVASLKKEVTELKGLRSEVKEIKGLLLELCKQKGSEGQENPVGDDAAKEKSTGEAGPSRSVQLGVEFQIQIFKHKGELLAQALGNRGFTY
uniref:Uncharacterized protein n=1 Tax=Oryza meridionalis TaxID=40149 RepID=A0A0E0E983_9ORYZ